MIGVGIAKRVLMAVGRRLCREPALTDVNFFLNSASMGGSERVHADIVEAVADRAPLVVFTERGKSSAFLARYMSLAQVEDISELISTRSGFYVNVGRYAAAINAREAPVVFGGFSPFFYRLVPELQSHVRCFDILHNFGGGFETMSLPAVPGLTGRVLISFENLLQMRALYESNHLDPKFGERLQVIENACDVPECPKPKPAGPFRVVFVGRGSPEKRIHLIGRIAAVCKQVNPDMDFTLVGDVQAFVEEQAKPSCTLTGPIIDPVELRHIYERSHVLLMASNFEGFPLVIMEAMAQGCVPVTTAVGGIPYRVHDGENGILCRFTDEHEIVTALSNALLSLASDGNRFAKLSSNAFVVAQKFFSRQRFVASYRALLLGEPPPQGYPVTTPPPTY